MRNQWIVAYGVCLHLVWVVVLLTFDSVNTTALGLLLEFFEYQRHIVGTILLVSSLLSILCYFVSWRNPWLIILLFPQEFLLALSMVSAIRSMILGQFADGIMRPHAFIVADQIPHVLAFMFHTIAIYEYTQWRNRRRGRPLPILVLGSSETYPTK